MILIQYSQRHSVINHCDRRITLLICFDIIYFILIFPTNLNSILIIQTTMFTSMPNLYLVEITCYMVLRPGVYFNGRINIKYNNFTCKKNGH